MAWTNGTKNMETAVNTKSQLNIMIEYGDE